MKCFIYDGGAQIVGRHSEPIRILRPEPNRVEIDPELLWQQFLTCFRRALLDAGVSGWWESPVSFPFFGSGPVRGLSHVEWEEIPLLSPYVPC